jgi:hypothetical protein
MSWEAWAFMSPAEDRDSCVLTQLLGEVPMVMTMMVMVVYDHHNLRLRRIGYCEAEEESQRKQNLFHTLVWRFAFLNTELL